MSKKETGVLGAVKITMAVVFYLLISYSMVGQDSSMFLTLFRKMNSLGDKVPKAAKSLLPMCKIEVIVSDKPGLCASVLKIAEQIGNDSVEG